MIKNTIILLAIIFLWAAIYPQHSWSGQPPVDRVKTMLNAIMTIQTDPALQGKKYVTERQARIKEEIIRNMDLLSMARGSLGKYWQEISRQEQEEFTAIFKELFLDSYSRMVLNFIKQEKIEYGAAGEKGEVAQVATTLIRDNDSIDVDYVLHRSDKSWLVTDVRVDGVFIIKNYKRSFAKIIRKASFEILLSKLRRQQKVIRNHSSK